MRWLALLFLLALGACSDQTHVAIRDACLKGISQTSILSSSSAQECECVADTAQKYLAQDDYLLFGKVAEIYDSNIAQDIKEYRAVNTLMDAGVDRMQAVRLAFSFAFLVERSGKECLPAN